MLLCIGRDVFELLILAIFTLDLVESLHCYVGDWSKYEAMVEVECGEKYCGIVLRQNGTELHSEANCYNMSNLKSKWMKKILINLSDSRLPNRVAFYVCHSDLCNRKSKYIQLKARYRSQKGKNQRLVIMNVDDEETKIILEHRANNFSIGEAGSEIIGSESNLTLNFNRDLDGSRKVYKESTKLERVAKDNVMKKYHHKSIFSEGRLESNEKDVLMFWKMFQ